MLLADALSVPINLFVTAPLSVVSAAVALGL